MNPILGDSSLYTRCTDLAWTNTVAALRDCHPILVALQADHARFGQRSCPLIRPRDGGTSLPVEQDAGYSSHLFSGVTDSISDCYKT
jgi:hypothetical protein